MLVALSIINGNSKERYYLTFNKDEIFKSLIACEGHFRNLKSTDKDSAGFLNCIVKHLADAEGHCDEAISHSLIVDGSDSSNYFLELRDEIRSFRRWVQSSPISRDEGIIEIRKVRRQFEGFNPDYDVSKCEACGDSEEIMTDITKIISDLKKNHQAVANHDVIAEEFLVMEQKMAQKLIAKLSKKYGVDPPKLMISDKCHDPNRGIYSQGIIYMCQSGINLHVLAHEFRHHVQKEKGTHMDEGEAEQFAIELFAHPPEKRLYALHSHSHSEVKMATIRSVGIGDIKDVGVIYGANLGGYGLAEGLRWLDTQRPIGFMGQPLSFWGDLLGAAGGVVGALYLESPYNLLAALVGGYLATDLVKHIIRIAAPAIGVAVPPQVALPPGTVPAPVITTTGRYTMG